MMACSVEACPRPIAVAMRFHGQIGHTHYCEPCGAEVREWYNVAESSPLPCPWGGHGITWIDYPPELT